LLGFVEHSDCLDKHCVAFSTDFCNIVRNSFFDRRDIVDNVECNAMPRWWIAHIEAIDFVRAIEKRAQSKHVFAKAFVQRSTDQAIQS
jgi:hypothetical protein